MPYAKMVQSRHGESRLSELFTEARQYVGRPGPLFRFATKLYAERSLGVLFLIHVISTLLVWGK